MNAKYPKHSSAPHLTILCIRHGGTHLVKPFVKRIVGLPSIDIYKLPGVDHTPNGPVAVSFRDPRNIIVSQARWTWKKRESAIHEPGFAADRYIEQLISERSHGDPRGATAIEVFSTVARQWKDYPGAVRCDFEDLTGPDQFDHAERIGRELGYPEVNARAVLMERLGKGHTFTGRHSDYREWFGPRATRAWEEHGGPALLKIMGYDE